jgi:hypothetical protein
MSAIMWAARYGVTWSQQQTARAVGAMVFLCLLAGLGAGLWRARKQIRENEVDAALEANFLELERALARPEVTAKRTTGDG